jgi:hypothetical protein
MMYSAVATQNAQAGYMSAVLSDSPVAYWTFDDGNLGDLVKGLVVKDSVGLGPNGDHPGTYLSTTANTDGPQLVSGATGIGGTAVHVVRAATSDGEYMSFDTLGSVGSNIDNNGVTFEFFFRNLQTDTTLNSHFGVFNNRPGGAVKTQLDFRTFAGNVANNGTQVFVRDDTPSTQQWAFDTSVKNINDGQWHHIAWVVHPGVPAVDGMSVYVDGVPMPLVNTDSRFPPQAMSNFSDFDKAFTVGVERIQSGALSGYATNAMYDEFAVYSSALTQAQVMAHLSAVPEPMSVSMMSIGGLLGLVLLGRRRRRHGH